MSADDNDWRTRFFAGAFLLALAVYGILVGLVALGLIGAIGGFALAFRSGYGFREASRDVPGLRQKLALFVQLNARRARQ